MVRIAIVDDSRLARTFTRKCLEPLGHELVEIEPTSLFDVLSQLRETPPDLLLMDLLMPNCPGASLARAFCEDRRLQDVRLLMISAHRDDALQERLSNFGVDAFLLKPFEPQSLVELVQGLLESRE
ncbi:MAG TPA: response regulator [Holophaga sp.]|nr:response regulator [Holophaga sp.]